MPKVLAREGRRKPEALPPDSECKHGTTPQGCPDKGDRKPSWPSRELPHEAVLSTWEGPGPWDPGGKPPREQTFESNKPVRAMDIAASHYTTHTTATDTTKSRNFPIIQSRSIRPNTTQTTATAATKSRIFPTHNGRQPAQNDDDDDGNGRMKTRNFPKYLVL